MPRGPTQEFLKSLIELKPRLDGDVFKFEDYTRVQASLAAFLANCTTEIKVDDLLEPIRFIYQTVTVVHVDNVQTMYEVTKREGKTVQSKRKPYRSYGEYSLGWLLDQLIRVGIIRQKYM